MAENITPEEKLLKLIENPNAAKIPKSPFRKIRFSFLAINRWLRVIKNIGSKERVEQLFNLQFVNKASFVATLVLTVYLVFDFIKARPDLADIYSLHSGRQTKKAKIETASILNLSDYLSQINQRDIFHLVSVKKEQEPPKAKEVFSSLMSNFRLVGIIWGKFPQAMIEDKQENKTLILNPGDEIGKIKVKQILRDRVILGYEDLEMELM